MTHPHMVIMLNPQNLSKADWVYLSETSDIMQDGLDTNLHDLTLLAKESNVTVIVPAQDVLLTSVTLPKLNRQRLRQALPYALEDQLISEIEELHFAIGEHQPDGSLPIAVVAKSKMELWVEMLKKANISPTTIIPATLAIPYTENKNTIYSYNDTYLIRTGKYSGFTADYDSLSIYQSAMASYPQSDSIHNPLNTLENEPIIHWHNYFKNSAKTLTSEASLNLLQKPYLAKRKSIRTKNGWKWVTYLAIAWITIAFSSKLISSLILHYQSNKIENEIERIYFQNFPQSKTVTAPRERMDTKLKHTTIDAQKNNFLGILAVVSKALSQTHGIRLQNMDYRNGQLTLEVSSATFDTLESLTQALTTQKLSVKQQNSSTSGSQVKATFIISAGAS